MHYIYQQTMYLCTASYNFGWFYGVLRHYQHYFSYIYIVAVSFIGGGNRSTRRKPEYLEKTGVPGENHQHAVNH